MPIRTVFFDVGGTLLHPDLPNLMAPLLERVTPTPEQLDAADRASKYSRPANGDDTPGNPSTNKGHWRVYFETLLASIESCKDDEALLNELVRRASDSSYWTVLDPNAATTLDLLKKRYRLAVISNADGGIRKLLTQAGIAGFFEQIVDSGIVGYEKPDPRIFRAALELMSVDAGESAYVGDIYGIDYQGATAVGMTAVLMDSGGVYRGWDVPALSSLSELPLWLQRRS